jgi:hypothetical protein
MLLHKAAVRDRGFGVATRQLVRAFVATLAERTTATSGGARMTAAKRTFAVCEMPGLICETM